jgi:hypothetical protein
MGLRRLRSRLDSIQGAASLTLQDARDLLADLQDGFGITVHIDADAAKNLMNLFMAGKECKLPISIQIDPRVDAKG